MACQLDLRESADKVVDDNDGKEYDDDVVFIRKIMPGSADRSYGIHVGKLAGLPDDVVARAQDILSDFEDGADNGVSILNKPDQKEPESAVIPFAGKKRSPASAEAARELPLFSRPSSDHPLIEEIKEIDIHNLTPLEALNRLNQLREKARKGNGGESVRVKQEEAVGRLGVLEENQDHRVVGFYEKPPQPKTIAGAPEYVLGSMGVYVFTAGALREALQEPEDDFGIGAGDLGSPAQHL